MTIINVTKADFFRAFVSTVYRCGQFSKYDGQMVELTGDIRKAAEWFCDEIETFGRFPTEDTIVILRPEASWTFKTAIREYGAVADGFYGSIELTKRGISFAAEFAWRNLKGL